MPIRSEDGGVRWKRAEDFDSTAFSIVSLSKESWTPSRQLPMSAVELRRHREGLVGQAHSLLVRSAGYRFVRCRLSSTALWLALIRRMACGCSPAPYQRLCIQGAPRRALRHCEQKRLTSRGTSCSLPQPCLPSRSSMEPKPLLHPVI